MRVLALIAKFAITVALTLVEAAFWCLRVLVQAVQTGMDALAAWRATRGGALRCPQGHEVTTDDIVCECGVCRFTYRGSLLRCGNVECHAISPYVNCPTCGLSVRNPYRWGRP